MGYNGSNRKGYDVRYRGFSKSSMRFGNSLLFGRRGLISGSLSVLGAGLLTPTRSSSRRVSSRSQTLYSFKTSSDVEQKKMINYDLKNLSDEAYAEITEDYFSRKLEKEKNLSQQIVITESIEEKRRHLKLLSLFSFFYKHKINDITVEIDSLSNQLESLKKQEIDTTLKLAQEPSRLSQSFVDSFIKLFEQNDVSVVLTSTAKYSTNEMLYSSHYYEIGRIKINVINETEPLNNAKCCCLSFEGLKLYFYSTVLIITKEPNEMAIMDYKDITMSNREVLVVESENFGTNNNNVIGYEYLHQCLDGTPDLRFKYNPRRPKILYRNLILRYKRRILFNFITNQMDPVNNLIHSYNNQKKQIIKNDLV